MSIDGPAGKDDRAAARLPAGPDRWSPGDIGILLSVGLGTFMSALDASVVNTVLPVIRAAFGAPVEAIQWVVTVYLLAMGGLLLTFGRLGDLRGHRRVFLLGFAVFVPASVACGVAPGEGTLIGARVVQGIGAAVIVSNSPANLVRSVHPSRIGRALGAQAAMTYLGLTLGPSLGGWLTEHLGWRSVFFINVPVGAAAYLLGRRHLPDDRRARADGERFDLAGTGLFTGAFFALLIGLNRGHDWGWTSAGTAAAFAACAVLAVRFHRREGRTPSPMLDLALFRNRLFTMAAASALVNYVCVGFVMFLVPFYLIAGRGLSPARAGLLLTVQSLAMVVTSPASGALADRVGSRVPATIGMAVSAAGLFVLSGMGRATPLSLSLAGLLLNGVGSAIFVTPNNSTLLGAAPKGRHGIASGILATSRLVGITAGVGISGAVLAGYVGGAAQTIPPDGVVAAVRFAFLGAGFLAVGGTFLAAARGPEAGPPARKVQGRS
ncbi:MAG: MFS transporter [Gemmatimonadota bacterium]